LKRWSKCSCAEALKALAPTDLAAARFKGVQVKHELLYGDGQPLTSESSFVAAPDAASSGQTTVKRPTVGGVSRQTGLPHLATWAGKFYLV